MIFREFYTGSNTDISPEERQILQSLFTTKSYVEREIEYSYTSTMGAVNQTALENWAQYLDKYREYIVSGTHFTNFAVQVSNTYIDYLFNMLCFSFFISGAARPDNGLALILKIDTSDPTN